MKTKKATKLLYFLYYALLILPHMNPPYVNEFPFVDFLINIARLGSFYLIVIRLFIVKRKLSKVAFLIGFIQVYLLIVTMLRQGETYEFIKSAFSVISVTFLYESLDNDSESFLSALLFCFEIVIYINLATIILYPDGMYQSAETLFISHNNYFLGYYNSMDRYFIPAFVTAWIYTEITGKRVRTFLLMAAVYISILLLWSGGMLLSIGCMSIAYLYLYARGRKNAVSPLPINYATCWLIHPIFFLGIIVFKWQTYFRWLIDDLLHKWYSFLTRMDLWDTTMRLISDHPIFGHGLWSAIARERESGFNFACHAHNMLLEILYQGGLIYLALFVALVIVAGKRLYARRDTKIAQIITIGFLGWCIHTTVEPYTTPFLMGLFILANKCDLFISAAEARRENPQYETPRQIGLYQARNLY